MRIASRTAAVLAGAVAVIGLTVGAASAASWDMFFDSDSGGHGHVWGALTYLSKTHFSYGGNVEDVCPADGLGVSYYYDIAKMSGGSDYLTGIVDWDTDGCDNGVSYRNDGVSVSFNIKKTRVVSCWTNNGNLCWAVPLDGISTWKDNPYTG